MRKFITGLALVLSLWACAVTGPLVLTSCTTSQQRVTVNSLASVGQATDAAIKTYLDQVVAGKVKTNDVPAVMARYNDFQAAWNIALVAATLNTNAPPTPEVTSAQSQVKLAIKAAQGK